MSPLPEMVKALLQPRAYPETPGHIELVQTQMSFVFLADDYVYKVKKPVNLGYLDYTTLEKRRFYCQREVELNQRLCAEAYLGVVPISRKGDDIFLGERGEVIEYAVKMRHLPRETMMSVLLAKNQVSAEMLTSVARKLARFHQQAETNAVISDFGDLETIIQNTGENFSQTIKYIGNAISQKQYHHIKTYTDNFIKQNAALFHRRIQEGKIRDCHGDLHAAHICFTNGICIYDCIEFNDRFRYTDIASEIAFLAMDIDYYGRPDLSNSFVGDYVAMSQDNELRELLNFYKCYRAYVRGKVDSFQLDDPHIPPEEKTKILADVKRYFELATSYITGSTELPL